MERNFCMAELELRQSYRGRVRNAIAWERRSPDRPVANKTETGRFGDRRSVLNNKLIPAILALADVTDLFVPGPVIIR